MDHGAPALTAHPGLEQVPGQLHARIRMVCCSGLGVKLTGRALPDQPRISARLIPLGAQISALRVECGPADVELLVSVQRRGV